MMRILPPLLLLALLGACVRQPVSVAPAPVPGPPSDGVIAPPTAAEAAAAAAAVDASEAADVAYLRERSIIVPVAGVRPNQLEDSFNEGRDGGRFHRAIDILAPRGTPIVAADDGRIIRLSTSSLGGITVYAVDPAGRIVYYYAHLDHYRDGLVAGMRLAKGDTIGFVGTTGNAPKDTPHLHFQIMRMPSDGRYWYGEPIDPYPLLGGGGGRR